MMKMFYDGRDRKILVQLLPSSCQSSFDKALYDNYHCLRLTVRFKW